MSLRLESLFQDYERFHKTRGNQISHLIGIPIIVVSLLGLLAEVPLPGTVRLGIPWNAGFALWVISSVFYLALNWKIGFPFILLLFVGLVLGMQLPIAANAGLFVLGWGAQFLGHLLWEKNSPAFFKNFLHLLIGPLWIFARSTGYRRRRKRLN